MDDRLNKAKYNIVASILIKGVDTLSQFLLVPITLGFLNQYEYGIWITISSVLVWINSFDIGLGNGLRNKLAEAMAVKEFDKAKSYISTTFGMLILLMSVIFFCGNIVICNIDIYSLLGVVECTVPNLQSIIIVSFALFCLNFVMKFIGNVYQGLQLPAVNNALVTLGHMCSLLAIYVMTKTTSGSLFLVAIVYSLSQPIVYILAYPVTFCKLYKSLRPSWESFNLKYVRSLLSVGLCFFLIQLAGVILFSLSNIIISNTFGPEQVTPYNITYRYFTVVSMLVAILLSPMWTAVTDAYAQGDMKWIRAALLRCHKILYLLSFAVVLMIVLSPWIYDAWLKSQIFIPMKLTIMMGIYMYVMAWSLCYSYFLNGMGLLRIQTVHTVVTALAFYPLCNYLGNLWGIEGILVTMILLMLPGLILNVLQVHFFMKMPNNSFWNK